MYALVGIADSTFHKSALCNECSFKIHFYIFIIYLCCIFFPIVFNFVISLVDLD